MSKVKTEKKKKARMSKSRVVNVALKAFFSLPAKERDRLFAEEEKETKGTDVYLQPKKPLIADGIYFDADLYEKLRDEWAVRGKANKLPKKAFLDNNNDDDGDDL